MAKKRVKSHKENVKVGSKVGLGGTGVEGDSTWQEIDVNEYEEHLASIRESKEAIPSIPIDEAFLKEAGHVYSKLSPEGKRNLNFLVSGSDEIGSRKYPQGTEATWVIPFVKEYLRAYEEYVLQNAPQMQTVIPFFKSKPIGAHIVLSEYQGLILEFIKTSDEFVCESWNLPVNGNFTDAQGLKHNLPPGGYSMSITPDEKNILWKVIYGSGGPKYFSLDKAREEAVRLAKFEIIHFQGAV